MPSRVDSKLKAPDKSTAEKAESLVCEVNTDQVDAAVANSELKEENTIAPNGTSTQAESVQFLKYTFRRKRRRESSDNNNESIAVDSKKSNLKKSAEKQNAQVKPQKSSLLTESPRSNRRLVQVARQVSVV